MHDGGMPSPTQTHPHSLGGDKVPRLEELKSTGRNVKLDRSHGGTTLPGCGAGGRGDINNYLNGSVEWEDAGKPTPWGRSSAELQCYLTLPPHSEKRGNLSPGT
ncbi:hypothetical protein DPEC_G00082800 [Dallia pectoralis]|uniref:Uncharacterized protein n=1 Tax=Dallia pectoralis TaxID=75939 RepID=A0ACC2GZ70_DALPE|nr:hypothetical protein DPEC_G00082800 [Dallia pectoralis]